MFKQKASIFLLLVCLALSLSCRESIEDQRNSVQPVPFEKQKWLGIQEDGLSDAEVRWNYRPGMARYLVNNSILIGKSRLEIIGILGESQIAAESSDTLNYELIQIFGSNIDPIAGEDLNIIFNQRNRVEKTRIIFRKFSDWKE